jgi:hypothetical protein
MKYASFKLFASSRMKVHTDIFCYQPIYLGYSQQVPDANANKQAGPHVGDAEIGLSVCENAHDRLGTRMSVGYTGLFPHATGTTVHTHAHLPHRHWYARSAGNSLTECNAKTKLAC